MKLVQIIFLSLFSFSLLAQGKITLIANDVTIISDSLTSDFLILEKQTDSSKRINNFNIVSFSSSFEDQRKSYDFRNLLKATSSSELKFSFIFGDVTKEELKKLIVDFELQVLIDNKKQSIKGIEFTIVKPDKST